MREIQKKRNYKNLKTYVPYPVEFASIASCVEAGRKDAFAERFVVTFCNSILMVLHVAVVSVSSFFHDFATSSRFPSFSPMICVRTLFIP